MLACSLWRTFEEGIRAVQDMAAASAGNQAAGLCNQAAGLCNQAAGLCNQAVLCNQTMLCHKACKQVELQMMGLRLTEFHHPVVLY